MAKEVAKKDADAEHAENTAPTASQVYIANESGVCQLGDDHYVFVKGVTRIRAGHALLKANPQYFDRVEESVHYDLEHATATPGEKRGEE